MYDVQQTPAFCQWLSDLRDKRAQSLIASRLERLKFGHFGDAKPVGGGVHELRIHYGPGYRMYYQRQGDTIIVLLHGGDKRNQSRDIAKAQVLALSFQTNGSTNHDCRTDPL